MKIGKNIRKLSAVIMTFAMLLGILPMLGFGITAKADYNPVKMYSTHINANRYGITSRTIYIQVDAASAANKAVFVHYELYNEEEWQDAQASFVTKLDDNTEIWRADITGIITGQFAIKYVGDGQVYWDNNNGKNYTNNDILGTAVVSAQPLRYASNGYTLRVAVKNLDYDKVVGVRYTLDNWATYHDVELSYEAPITETDSEYWVTTLNVPIFTDGFEFCVYYKVNGQTYWDNNFGSNYNSSYFRAY